jgi:prevent-host-death family protein
VEEQRLSISEARANLPGLVRAIRSGAASPPVLIGLRGRPDVVMLPYARYRELIDDAARPLRPTLHRYGGVIQRLADANGLDRVEVFGSVARGNDDADSDVDLLVDPRPEATLFDLAQFEIDVEDLIGRRVHVVSRRALRDDTDARILAEAVPL